MTMDSVAMIHHLQPEIYSQSVSLKGRFEYVHIDNGGTYIRANVVGGLLQPSHRKIGSPWLSLEDRFNHEKK
jgi:hypothetical protein